MSSAITRLPATWLALSLGDAVNYGETRKADPAEIDADTWVLELEDIERDSSRVLMRRTFAQRQSKSTKNRFDAGDVLYGKLRPYLNKVVYADASGVCTTEIVPIKPNAVLSGRYLFHWLRHPCFQRYVTEVSHGIDMPRLGTEAGRRAPLVLAPVAEQQRIADKLDTVLARVDACRDRLARVAALLRDFRQSVLAAAVLGQLTEDWRADTKAQWSPRATSVGSLGRVVTGSTPSKKLNEYFGGDVPFFKPSDLDAGYEVIAATEHLSRSGASVARLLPARTVLVTCIGATIGKVGLSRTAGATNQQINAVVCLPHLVLPEWLYFWFASPLGQASVIGNASATTLPIINKSRFAALVIDVPDTREQTEIVRRVESLFAYADRLEARLASARTAVDRLTPALLAKAFRGELVPQDPNDEPAAELLRRLAESRQAAAAKPRRRQPA